MGVTSTNSVGNRASWPGVQSGRHSGGGRQIRASGQLRLGLLTDGAGFDVDPECVVAAERAAAVLEGMGHHVMPVTGDVLFGGDGKVNGTLWMAVSPAESTPWASWPGDGCGRTKSIPTTGRQRSVAVR